MAPVAALDVVLDGLECESLDSVVDALTVLQRVW